MNQKNLFSSSAPTWEDAALERDWLLASSLGKLVETYIGAGFLEDSSPAERSARPRNYLSARALSISYLSMISLTRNLVVHSEVSYTDASEHTALLKRYERSLFAARIGNGPPPYFQKVVMGPTGIQTWDPHGRKHSLLMIATDLHNYDSSLVRIETDGVTKYFDSIFKFPGWADAPRSRLPFRLSA